MIPLKIGAIEEIMAGRAFANKENIIDGTFEFDSREINPGDVFIALPGEMRDGHEFVEDAFARGAKLAITSKPVAQEHILVPDVITAISKLANHLRRSLPNLKIVGITGSQGKTTTKDMLATVLSKDGKTIAPIGSYNNEIGVPITLLRANGETKYAVLEMGARHMGDIAKLTEIAEPNVGIVLKVGVAHLGEFGSRENIARTKGELIRGLRSGSTAVLGTYDEFTPHIADGLDLKVLHFGETTECDVRAADIEIKGGFASFDLVTSSGRERVELQILGQHQIANALAAAAAATSFGLDIRTIAEGLSEHSVMSKWRMELHQIGDITIINDAYNSNPESCKAALQTLRQLTQERGGRSWAFLGKMHELGETSDQLHNEVGASALASNIDNLIVIAEPSFVAGLSSTSTFIDSVSDWQAAGKFLTQVESGDVILIKGSRAEKLDLLAIETLNFFKNKYEGVNQ